ncbi:hypothetical protein BV25DRAFT_1061236 [Artomyces pyxidatus]|uniref:Uncharacterized protein n=1 Tax=Artomyces pyxidatus TaxID=48021 RepID=A0ACB8SUT8_9AGAM|nr:hypothetical protein BV25DRAFT_1061236 [Artomyces pyxidatus]
MTTEGMEALSYVEIPTYATRLPGKPSPKETVRPTPKITTAIPHSDSVSESPAMPSSAQLNSPSRVFGNLPGLLLASSLQIPANAPAANPRTGIQLLSTRDPLSVPITTVNFRRFISKIGPVWWLQDRIEEVLMWRKGWKVTVMWMALYTFICYFPRLILLLPNVAILAVLLAAHPSRRSADTESLNPPEVLPPPRANAREGSAEWLANIQGIQNLMGAFADAHDAVFPTILHLTYATPYTPHICTLTIIATLITLPLLPLIPLRPLFITLGLTPFVLTHPFTHRTLPLLLSALPLGRWRGRVTRAIDDDRLKDRHWRSPMRDVELFENERWVGGDGGSGTWSKSHLKPGERVPWTRGRDGWSGLSADGSGDVSSNLTFALEPGWVFVETEDWRADTEGEWSTLGSDEFGWVYTNDAWLDPRAAPSDEWKTQGAITRRRRWTRRIYFNPTSTL